MPTEKRVFPTCFSVLSAFCDIKGQLPVEGYDREKFIDILRQAIQDYKEDPRDLNAISRIQVIANANDMTLYRGAADEILRTNFSPDILTESLIVWKKARHTSKDTDAVLVKLELPVGARVVRSLFSNKCRTDKAKVLAITSLDGSISYQTARSDFVWDYYYNVGEVVEPHLGIFDDRPWVSCSSGIHFFETKEEAIEYDFR